MSDRYDHLQEVSLDALEMVAGGDGQQQQQGGFNLLARAFDHSEQNANRHTQEEVACIAASAQVKSAQISAEAAKYGANMQFAGQMMGMFGNMMRA